MIEQIDRWDYISTWNINETNNNKHVVPCEHPFKGKLVGCAQMQELFFTTQPSARLINVEYTFSFSFLIALTNDKITQHFSE